MQQMSEKLLYIPKKITEPALYAYFGALVLSSVVFYRYVLPWYYLLAGAVSVTAVFYYGNALSKRWCVLNVRRPKRFEERLFWTAFGIRLIYMLLIYTVFMLQYGNPFGFENMDACYYDHLGRFVADMVRNGNFHFYDRITSYFGSDLSDIGYGIYLGFIYLLTGNSVFITRVIKCLLSALTALLVYRLGARNFGDQTGRIAGILCMLWPNFWYYCGCQLKETEMLFLTVWFAYETDSMLRSRQLSVWRILPSLLIMAAMFTIRTPLAVVLILALLFSVVMSSTKMVSWGKKVVIGLLSLSLIGVTMGNRIIEETQALVEENAGGQMQKKNMEWRSIRDNGNKFAKYASTAVFAPLIFTLPFSTMVNVPEQDVQKLLHGGNFAKNILSFFVLLCMFQMLFSGDWRQHTLLLALFLGYLVVLSMSAFAQSERFHQPAMPFAMLFAAYGIAHCGKREKRWYVYWAVAIVAISIVWGWFKLKGRGLI